MGSHRQRQTRGERQGAHTKDEEEGEFVIPPEQYEQDMQAEDEQYIQAGTEGLSGQQDILSLCRRWIRSRGACQQQQQQQRHQSSRWSKNPKKASLPKRDVK